MSPTAADDVPVETGHDLILSTLLVHFDADEIDQLPHALQPVVQDVYDVARNLVETKVKYQWEMTQMRAALELARTELAAERSSHGSANREAACTAAAQVTAMIPATRGGAQRHKPPATRTTATQTRMRLPSRVPVFGKTGQPPDGHHGVAVPEARARGSPLMGRPALPLRNCALDAMMAVANVGSPDAKRRSSLTQAFRIKPRCPSAPASTGSQQVVSAPQPAKAVRSAPGKAVSTARFTTNVAHLNARHDEQGVRACLLLQITSEHRLHAIQMKLNQLIQWKSEYIDGHLRVCIGSTGSVINGVRSYSIEDIQAALNALQEEATELLDSCVQVLDRVPDASDAKLWLRDRHMMLDGMVMQLDEWFVDAAIVLDAFPSASTANKRRSPISVRIWSDVKTKHSYVNATTINVNELREQCVMPTRLNPVLTEFATCSFVAQVIGVFSLSSLHGENYATLTQIGLLARDLEWLVERCNASQALASNDDSVEQWRVAKSFKIFKVRHSVSLKALQRRATVCSEAICGVRGRIRGTPSPLEASYASQPMRTTHAHFPASVFTWAYYDDMVLSIVSCHVTLTRVVNVPRADRAAALFNIIKRLDELVESMAPWVDPRFADETDSRSFEKREYCKLMDWCERMCSHVARFDADEE